MIKPLITFSYIYRREYLWQLLMYWNYLPFFAYLFIFGGQVIGTDLVILICVLVASLILFVNQLYLWYFGFFTAQEASQGFIGVPDLEFSEVFTGYGVKFRLALIRIFYTWPLLLLVLVLLVPMPMVILIAGVAVFATYFLIVENYLLPAALYQYSYTNSVFAALNLAAVIRFIFANMGKLTVLAMLNIAFYVVTTLLVAAVSLLLVIPIVGVVLLSLLNGFVASWQVIYIPTLMGQIWASYNESDQS